MAPAVAAAQLGARMVFLPAALPCPSPARPCRLQPSHAARIRASASHVSCADDVSGYAAAVHLTADVAAGEPPLGTLTAAPSGRAVRPAAAGHAAAGDRDRGRRGHRVTPDGVVAGG